MWLLSEADPERSTDEDAPDREGSSRSAVPHEQDGADHVTNAAEQDFRAQLARAERDIGRRIDPGTRALVIVGVMLVLMATSVIPWIGAATGWQVLVGDTAPVLQVDLLPRLFAINATIAGVGLGALALTTRRWALAFLAAMACSVVALEGVIAIWARQTVPAAGPSVGLVIAVVSMFVLASQWLRIAWSRP